MLAHIIWNLELAVNTLYSMLRLIISIISIVSSLVYTQYSNTVLFGSRPPKRAAPTLEVEDEFDFETERSSEAKTKKANDVLRCTVSGCPSYVTKHVFATLQNYKKHIG